MHKIVMLSGKQGSGKSTLADGLVASASGMGYVPVRTRFAKILYEMHNAAVAVANMYGIEAGPKEGEMLQWIGTEWGRKLKGEDVWVKALVNDVKNKIKDNDSIGTIQELGEARLLFIIDDMRFENEFHAFDGSGLSTLKVRLECSEEVRKARCSYWRPNTEHPSETGLDLYSENSKFDQYIRTEGPFDAGEVLDFVVRGLE